MRKKEAASVGGPFETPQHLCLFSPKATGRLWLSPGRVYFRRTQNFGQLSFSCCSSEMPRRPRLLASTRAVLHRLIPRRCVSSRLKAGDPLRSPASSASVAHPFIGLWRVTDAYSGGFRFSIFVTSGNFNGYSPSQSRHRNLRPPAFTSVHRMGLLHLRQRGGGRFLTTMMLTLNWAGAQNSQSPIEAEDGR